MLVSEEEAKTKWCPETRTGLTAGMAVNHHIGGDVHDETRCIGSACMMWRWHAWTEYVPDELDGVRFKSSVRISSTHGFCGKAGAPKGIADPTNPPPEENQ